MDAVYKRRRIIAAIVAFVLLGTVGKMTYEAGAYMVNRITDPTFVCEPGTHAWQHGDRLWDIADVRCSGNITDAARQIMDDNGIKGKDLSTLRIGTIIVIKKGDK